MADVLKSIMNKITDDDPATRGQQLWVMFTLAIFLVAILNYYAMVREPDIVDMDELIEYKNEVVKVEGATDCADALTKSMAAEELRNHLDWLGARLDPGRHELAPELDKEDLEPEIEVDDQDS